MNDHELDKLQQWVRSLTIKQVGLLWRWITMEFAYKIRTAQSWKDFYRQ